MRNDTKILLAAGTGIYVLMNGVGDLIVRTTCAAGAYACTRIASGSDLRDAIDGLNTKLNMLPDDRRKAAIQSVRDRLERDEGTLRLAASAVAVGAFLNPFVALVLLGVFAAMRYEAKKAALDRNRSRLERTKATQQMVQQSRAARA